MIESQPQHQSNQRHIQSQSHHAKVLPAFLPDTFPGVGKALTRTVVPDLLLSTQSLNEVVGDTNEPMLLLEDYNMEVEREPVASSSALQLENHPAVSSPSIEYTSATSALNFLRPQQKKKKTAKKQVISDTAFSIPSVGFITGASS